MSIWELIIIIIVALIVIKPERLPEVAFFVGKFIARCRKWHSQVLEKYNQLM